jgi:MFS family permease
VHEATLPRVDAGPRVALRLIASRSFGPYFVANAMSATGMWFWNLAAALLVFRETDSELLLGVLTFVQFVPLLVLAPWAGAAADRLDRRRVVLVTQVGAALLAASLALLTWLDLASAPVVIGWSLALGVATAFASPAALLPSLVEPEDVASAVGLNSMTYNIASCSSASPPTRSIRWRPLSQRPSAAPTRPPAF